MITMADPPPIQQRISIDADTRGVDEVSRGLDRVEQETQDTAAAALASARASGELDDQLRDLTATQRSLAEVEVDHQAKVAAGEAVTESEAQASAERQAQLRGLTAALTAEADRQEQINRMVAESATTTATAAAGEATREDRLRQLRGELESLIRDQDRYERSTQQGEQATEAAEAAERERLAQIDRLGRELADEDRIQRRTTEAVYRHRDAQDQAKITGGEYGGAIDLVSTRMAGLVTGIVGAGGAIRALQLLGEELDKRIEQTREFADAQLNLQFLGDTFDPQEREFIGRAAVLAGREPAETARAFTEVKSFFPSLSKQELQEFFLEVAETGATTDAPLASVAKLQQSIFAINRDAAASQNIARAATVQAGVGNPDVLANVFGKLLSTLVEVGNIDVGQAAGASSAVTGLDTREASEQATGLRSVVLSLLGDLSDDQRNLVGKGKIDTRDALSALQSLGEAIERGRLDNAAVEQLVGAEGIATATALADPQRRREFFSKVKAVDRAEESGEDQTRKAIEQQFTGDPVQATAFAIKQVEALDAVARGSDADALRSELARKLQDAKLREAGVGPVGRFFARESARITQLLGGEDETAIDVAGGVLDITDAFTLQGLGQSAGSTRRYEADQRVKEQLKRLDDQGFIDTGPDAEEQSVSRPEVTPPPTPDQPQPPTPQAPPSSVPDTPSPQPAPDAPNYDTGLFRPADVPPPRIPPPSSPSSPDAASATPNAPEPTDSTAAIPQPDLVPPTPVASVSLNTGRIEQLLEQLLQVARASGSDALANAPAPQQTNIYGDVYQRPDPRFTGVGEGLRGV